jgi:hypothetical protein
MQISSEMVAQKLKSRRRMSFLPPNSLISPIKKLVNLIVYVKFFSQKSPENPCGVLILSLVLEYKILRDV